MFSKPKGNRYEDELAAILAVILIVPSVGAWMAWWLAERFSEASPVPDNPITMGKLFIDGDSDWPPQAWFWLAVLASPVLIVFFAFVWRVSGSRLDRLASRLPTQGLRRYQKGKGPIIGRTVGVSPTRTLRMTTEDQSVIVAGPRTGKTTTQAIPAVLNHKGSIVVTSNKRDIYDAVVEPKSEDGRVWLFDPQNIAPTNQAQRWWWNPLSVVTDISEARALAGIWSDSSKDLNAKTDSYFDPASKELLTGLILAASIEGVEVSKIYEWLIDPKNTEPADILNETSEYGLAGRSVKEFQDLPDKQRSGVYGGALKTMGWVTDPSIRQWCENSSNDLTHFDIAEFVESTDTLISLSREGETSATALVTALTAAVLTEAETLAAHQSDGRLEVPLLGVLDEAANVCRWQQLPDLYSHYGSRGIILMSIFQSWAQIQSAYGNQGAEKLWSAANVRVYGGGVSDTTFLKRISELCGDYDQRQDSVSSNHHAVTKSRSLKKQATLDVSMLGALPPKRAVVLLSAATPTVVKLKPYWKQKTLMQRFKGFTNPQIQGAK